MMARTRATPPPKKTGGSCDPDSGTEGLREAITRTGQGQLGTALSWYKSAVQGKARATNAGFRS